jgi:hypothetical protein
MKKANERCTKCENPSIPGLLRGAGKCQNHYNEGQFGKKWADKCNHEKQGKEFRK